MTVEADTPDEEEESDDEGVVGLDSLEKVAALVKMLAGPNARSKVMCAAQAAPHSHVANNFSAKNRICACV